MKKKPTRWYEGPPPEIGWWPASVAWDTESIRWWNGKEWSLPVTQAASAKEAAKAAKRPQILGQEFICWTDRWWL